jgi:hypothetical protein
VNDVQKKCRDSYTANIIIEVLKDVIIHIMKYVCIKETRQMFLAKISTKSNPEISVTAYFFAFIILASL